MAKSTNKGLTWSATVSTNIGPYVNGAGEAPLGRDMLFMAHWPDSPQGNVYVLHAMKGFRTSYSAARGRVPYNPYESDMWMQPWSPNGPTALGWTFLANDLVRRPGQFDAFCAYNASVWRQGNTYYNFYNASRTAAELNIGLAIGPTATGPFTPQAAGLFNDSDVQALVPENPKTFWHPGLNRFVMLCNEGNLTLGTTDQNSYVLSESLTTWKFTDRQVFQRIGPLNGLYTLGIPSPIYKSNGLPIITADGRVPFTFDCDPLGEPFPMIHVGRHLRYGVMEPSPLAFRYAGGSAGPAAGSFTDTFDRAAGPLGNGWGLVEGDAFVTNGTQLVMATIAHSDVMVNAGATFVDGSITVAALIDYACAVDVVFRYTGPNAFYFIELNPGFSASSSCPVAFYKKDATGYNQIGATVMLPGGTFPGGALFTARVELSGSTYRLYKGTELLASFTDSTFTGSGQQGLRSDGGGTGRRWVDTFTGTPAGTVATGSTSAVFNDAFDGSGALAASWSLVEGVAFTQGGGQANLGNSAGNLMVNNTVSFTNGTVAADVLLSDGGSVGMVFRYASAAAFYMVDFSQTDGKLFYAFYKKTGPTSGDYTQIGTGVQVAPALFTARNAFRPSVQVNGSTYSVFVGSTQVAQLTENSYLAAGLTGLRSGNSIVGATRLADNFRASDDNTVISNPVDVPTLARNLTHGDYVAEFVVQFDNAAQNGYAEFHGRMQANGDHYTIRVQAGGALLGGKMVSGGNAALPALAGTSTNQKTVSGLFHVVRVVQQSTSLKAYLDNELQINCVDASFLTGSRMAVVTTGSTGCRVRNLAVYDGTAVRLTNAPAGATVTLRGAGGVPLATTVANGGSVDLVHAHYPVASIDVNGTQVAAPAGGIWGGDLFAYTA